MADARLKLAETIFDAAVELQYGDREALLAERCGDDHALRALVESLLANHDSGLGSFLSPPAAATNDDGPRATALPDRIGPYEILGRIAEGGMGTVYEARQERPRRAVALKVIRPASIGLSARKRFHFEVEVLGQLRHAGIVQIYEAGEAETPWGAQPYFAMERIHGRSLMDYVDHQNLGARDRLELLAKVCDAVHYAHEKGVLHRDLKPGNILVEERADSAQPKILDFGVARALCSDLHLVTTQTQAGQIVGTLAYMSPEQVRGRMDELDRRSDVYSLGVIMYELLAGRLPYDLTDLSVLEAGRVIQEVEPVRIGRINHVYRGDAETILERALAKEVERRYPSAAALADELRRYLAGRPITARPASALYRLRKAAKRNQVLLVTAGWMTVVGIGGGLWWRASQEPASPSRSLESSARRLTAAVIQGNTLASAAISAGGERFIYREGWDRFLLQEIATGEARPLPLPEGRERGYVEWFPDGDHVLSYEGVGRRTELLRISLTSGERERLLEGPMSHPSVSPDGKHIAFLRDSPSELWICGGDGTGAQRIVSAEAGGYLLSPAWGPGGQRIAYLRYGADFRGTLETCDLRGEAVVVLDERRFPQGSDPLLCWLPDGRLVFPSVAFPGYTVELHVADVDPTTGRLQGDARRLLGWDSAKLAKPTASADGRRLLFTRKDRTFDIYVLEINELGAAVEPPRRLTQENWPNERARFSPEGRDLFFASSRSGNVDILVQGLEERDPRLLVSGPTHDFPECVSPYSSELLFWRAVDPERETWILMRVPTTGGVPEHVPNVSEHGRVRCGMSPGGILGQRINGDLIFRSFDLESGKGDEIARLELDGRITEGGYGWDLSRDGSRILLVENTGRVRILDLDTHEVQEPACRTPGAQSVAWSDDGVRMIVTGIGGDTFWIKCLDFEGHEQTLWETENTWLSDPVLSPDGQHAAFRAGTVTQDVWMIEGF